MQSPVSSNDPVKGLPPVQPPTGKFLAQLFLVPLGIVTVAVSILVFLNWLVGGYLTPEQMLKNLRSGNIENRWRAASDLAEVIDRDPNLASNPSVALEITELLRQAVRDSEQAERTPKKTESATATSGRPKDLSQEQKFVVFLTGCTGRFSIPTAVPVLNEIALNTTGTDPEWVAHRRLRAVEALAILGNNLKRFDQLSPERRAAVRTELEQAAAGESGTRQQDARLTLDYLTARDAGTPPALGVDRTMEQCAKDNDLLMRQTAALALTFWTGTPAENERMEAVLLKLSSGEDVPSDAERVRVFELRAQAVQALARRGSKRVSERTTLLHDMLDENELAKIFRVKVKDKEVADTAIIGVMLTDTLKSVDELHRKLAKKGETFDWSPLLPAIDTLASHENAKVRKEATQTRLALTNP